MLTLSEKMVPSIQTLIKNNQQIFWLINVVSEKINTLKDINRDKSITLTKTDKCSATAILNRRDRG